MLRILGLDPGTARLGFAIIDFDKNNTLDLVDCGVIETHKDKKEELRLVEIRDDLESIIDKFKPDVAVIEQLFFFKNPKTIIPVAQARGVIVELCAGKGLHIQEYTPLEMKKIITGDGMASKDFVSDVVHRAFDIDTPIKPDDAVDAVGLALSFVRSDLVNLINQ